MGTRKSSSISTFCACRKLCYSAAVIPFYVYLFKLIRLYQWSNNVGTQSIIYGDIVSIFMDDMWRCCTRNRALTGRQTDRKTDTLTDRYIKR